MKKSLYVSIFQINNFMHESQIKRVELIVLSEVYTQIIGSFSPINMRANDQFFFLNEKK